MDDFELNVKIYKLIGHIQVLLEHIFLAMPFIFAIRTLQISKKKEKTKITKQTIFLYVIWGISASVIYVIHDLQWFNVENVFDSEYEYVGQTLNGMAHGKGKKYDLDDNLVYDGDFKANQYRGDGKDYVSYLDENNTYITYLQYDGRFANGLYNGHGKLYWTGLAFDVDNPILQYEGEFVDNQKCGTGIEYRLPDKDGNVFRYEGEFANDMYNGNGKMFLNDKLLYDGEFMDNQKCGFGVEYCLPNEDGDILRYEGEFLNGMYNGNGKVFLNDKLLYEGGFANGMYNGNGKVFLNDNLLYQGGFANGMYNGNGKKFLNKNLTYEGEFANGMYNGNGKMFLNDKLVYDGEYVDNQRCGFGIEYYLPDEDGYTFRYEGEFSNGIYNGSGKMFLNNKLIYDGKYVDNQRCGFGIEYYMPDEDGNIFRYEGEFANGIYNGNGKMFLNDELVYEGEFVNNQESGFGIKYCLPDEDGDILRYEGEFVKGMYNGNGKMFLNDELVYEGEFADGMYNGNGKMFLNGELIYEGEFIYSRPLDLE